MKAVILQKTGDIENLEMSKISKPRIASNEVLIETKALSVNPVDYKVRADEDLLTAIYGDQRPAILGWDVAGIVVDTGHAVSKFKKGDRVFGMVNFLGAGNAYAEYVAAPESHLATIPEQVSYTAAAASTLAALTAHQVLNGKIKPNDRVLIHAGSGGVGHFAIQIAKAMGAFVISTSSAKNKDFILALGADQHVDYRTQAFEKVLQDIDFVFDMFNGEVLLNSVKVVKKGGTVVSIPTPDFADAVQKLAAEKGVDLAFHMVTSNGDDMNTIANYLQDGTVQPHVSKVFQFSELQEAHRHLESGRTVGKIAIEL